MVKLPAGACNAHCHVFGPRERFPYAPDAAYVPQQDAPKEALFALNDRLSAGVSYSGQYADEITDNAVKGRLTWLFH